MRGGRRLYEIYAERRAEDTPGAYVPEWRTLSAQLQRRWNATADLFIGDGETIADVLGV